MRIGERLPNLLARARGERVRVAMNVTEENGEPRIFLGELADGESAPDHRIRAEAPVHATSFRVERIDVTGIRRHIQSAVVYRLTVQRGGARKSEGPLQLQARDLPGSQSGCRGGLEPRISIVNAPAVPGRRPRLADLRTARASVRHLLGGADQLGVELPSAHPFGDESLVLIAQPGGHVSHRAGRHDLEDPFRRHLFEHSRLRRLVPRVVALVARGTVGEVLIDASAFRLRGRGCGPREHRREHDRAPCAGAAYFVV